MTNQEFISRIKELKDLERMQEELSNEIESIKDILKHEMDVRKETKIVLDIYKVSYVIVTTSRLDATMIKKELPEVAQKYSKSTESKRFTVTV